MDTEPTLSERIADAVTQFSGSMAFLCLNAGWFLGWIVVNTLAPRLWHFDPYPFQFLTMSVSLEAIFLSVFVLISQNRQAARERATNEHDLQVDLEAREAIKALLKQLERLETLLKVCE